jgi:hypothetical protein
MTKRLSSGAKSTEFWVVAAFIIDFFLQRAGVYGGVSADQVMDAADQVRQLAEQLRGETGTDSDLVYLLGALYVAGRSMLKWRAERA